MTYQQSLWWDDSYAIALKLNEARGRIQLEQVSLDDIYHWTLSLENFADDASLANDDLLRSIFIEWLEITLD